MPEQNKPFVITDRRKFTKDGEPRPDADPSPEREPATPTPVAEPPISADLATPPEADQQTNPPDEQTDDMPPALTEEQISQAKYAYDQTADRLDTAIRAANPGMDHMPPMTFDGLIQSVYMTSIMQLGGSTPEGEKPRVDLMGARQSIDMLDVLEAKTKGNLSEPEARLLESALFELRMAFLEVTQALARSAAAQNPGSLGGPGGPAGPGRPSIVR